MSNLEIEIWALIWVIINNQLIWLRNSILLRKEKSAHLFVYDHQARSTVKCSQQLLALIEYFAHLFHEMSNEWIHRPSALIRYLKKIRRILRMWWSIFDPTSITCMLVRIKSKYLNWLFHHMGKFLTDEICFRSALVFPPVSNFRRFLIHHLVDTTFRKEELSTLSIGSLYARRTVVYPSVLKPMYNIVDVL